MSESKDEDEWRADVAAALIRIETLLGHTADMVKQLVDQQNLPEKPERGLGH
jgi:hypothetical protein